MRIALLLAALVLAGCASVGPRAGEPFARVPESPAAVPAFDAPVRATSCGTPIAPVACHEPTIVVTPSGVVLVANSFSAPMGRSTDGGATFVQVPDLLGQFGSRGGGDALLQLAPDGSVWWSVLEPTGLRITRSTDDGLTWTAAVHIDMGGPTDRQWLAVARDGVILATVQGKAGTRAAISTDGGATFGGPVTLSPQTAIGGAPAAIAGELVVPRFDYVNSALVVDVTKDRAATWTTRVVAKGEAIGDFFPIAHADGPDIVLAWRSLDRAVLIARSADGGASWSAPVQASRASDRVAASPWLEGEGDRLTLAYFSADKDSGPATLHVVRLANGTVARGIGADGILTTLRKDRPGNTDFAHVTLDASGRAFVTFAASDGSIQVAREKR